MKASIASRVLSSVTDSVLGRKPDLSFGFIQQLGINKDLAERRWDVFENKIYTLNADNLTRVLDGLCLTNRYDNALQKYIASGESQVRNLASGSYNLHIAWLKRGGQWGNSLSTSQISGFDKYLARAQDDLTTSFSNTVYEAEAKARLIRVKMGMSDGAAAQKLFGEVMNLDSNHLLAHLNYFKAASPKWLGDVDILYNLVMSVESKE